jgi:hypothetical protein
MYIFKKKKTTEESKGETQARKIRQNMFDVLSKKLTATEKNLNQLQLINSDIQLEIQKKEEKAQKLKKDNIRLQKHIGLLTIQNREFKIKNNLCCGRDGNGELTNCKTMITENQKLKTENKILKNMVSKLNKIATSKHGGRKRKTRNKRKKKKTRKR